VRNRAGPASRACDVFQAYAYGPAADKDYVYTGVARTSCVSTSGAPQCDEVLRKGEVRPIGVAVEGEYVYIHQPGSTEGARRGAGATGKPGSVARMGKSGDGFERPVGHERPGNLRAGNLPMQAKGNVFLERDERVRGEASAAERSARWVADDLCYRTDHRGPWPIERWLSWVRDETRYRGLQHEEAGRSKPLAGGHRPSARCVRGAVGGGGTGLAVPV